MSILFCRDGILRESVHAYDRRTHVRRSFFIPVLVTQVKDEQSFLKKLHAHVSFEAGLTVAELFGNLEPWQNLMTGIACMDFPAFVAESRKQGDAERMNDLDRIEIAYSARIDAVPEFKGPRPFITSEPDERGLREIHLAEPHHSDLLRVEEGWSYSALYKSPYFDENAQTTVSSCSLDYSPICDWAHLPIVIARDSALVDETTYSRVYLSSNRMVTDETHPLARIERRGERVVRVDFPLSPPSPTFFSTIVEGFLWEIGFHYSPIGRDEASADIKASIDEIEDYDPDKASAYEREYELQKLSEEAFERKHLDDLLALCDEKGLKARRNGAWDEDG